MEQLFEKIDQERLSRFQKPWSKLDRGGRINRIYAFVKMEKTQHNLSDETESKLKILLIQLCETGGLNKSSDVSYDEDSENIISIKNLEYDSDTKQYTYSPEIKKHKSTQKSKGNIERHFSRSKESKR